ncbi:pyrroline-5-carboxylate reductase [Fibrobacterales bacterium]|nr:pyrroline-5-carboxylate reductase [Fibrobacterales bacterium]
MGGAILNALTGSGYPAGSVFFYEPENEQAAKLSKSGAKRVSEIEDGFLKADVVFLCIKPQIFSKIANSLASDLDKVMELRADKSKDKPIIVSIMAGVPISKLQSTFDGNAVLVRTMPNIALTVGKGTVAISSDGVSDADLQTVEFLLSTCSNTVRVSESQMDAVTGLSGSAPAFVFQFVEALAMGGVKMGLSRDVAMNLALSTIRGAHKMLKESGLGTGELTANVCSPAGTTIAGIQELEKGAFRGVVMAAVEAAALRSAELGK